MKAPSNSESGWFCGEVYVAPEKPEDFTAPRRSLLAVSSIWLISAMDRGVISRWVGRGGVTISATFRAMRPHCRATLRDRRRMSRMYSTVRGDSPEALFSAMSCWTC